MIPDYAGFFSVDEQLASTRRLAQDFPDVVRVRQVAQSQQGDPIVLITIGDGPLAALWYSGSHANEPVGCMVIEYWARHLCEDAALRDRLGYTWHFIKCIDPDAMRRNEAWFRGSFSLTAYSRHFYQQPLAFMPEFNFPLHYQNLHADQPQPMTRVLMQLIDKIKPQFVNSLHCGSYGGVYVDVSQPCAGLYPALHNIVADLGLNFLPHDLMKTPDSDQLAEGIALGRSTQGMYDLMLTEGHPAPEKAISHGGSMRDYVSAYNSFWINAEIDLMQDPRVADQSDSDQLWGDLQVARHEFWQEQADWARPLVEALKPALALDFNRSLMQVWRPRIVYYRGKAPAADDSERWATVSEALEQGENQKLRALREIGMLLGLLEAELEAGNTALEPGYAALLERFDSLATDLEAQLEYTFLPVRDLVAYQLAAGVAAADYVRQYHRPA